ncbi:Type 1 phosphatases regulator ypi1 [Cadophora gregata f. sp. sojae]|nr:Type 1 phosphatases regulator ypi1 [Cadophora gregata f. sp. sojae]
MATTLRAPVGQQTQLLQTAPQTSSTTRTQTQTQTRTQAVLHLRGAPLDSERGSTRRRIKWAEDVVDNEGLGRKKSKVCCIYHAPKGIDESSDESSSSDSGSESDSGDDGSARPVGGGAGRGKRKGNGNGNGCGHGHGHGKNKGQGDGSGEGSVRKRSPNAYERMPKVKGAAKEK